MKMNWKKGRGKLGLFKPLIGSWLYQADNESINECNMKLLTCKKRFSNKFKNYIHLTSTWSYKSRDEYQEICLIGLNNKKEISFWSFTNDGKQSSGNLVSASDIHPNAIAFVSEMQAGVARQVYWPDKENGFHWVVESKNKNGWNRFLKHHYKNVL